LARRPGDPTVTLTFAAASDLTADAPRVVEALRGRGVAVLPVRTPASTLDALRDGSLDLLLVRGDEYEELAQAGEVRAAAVLRREEPRDVLIPGVGRPSTLALLPGGSRIGASGERRRGFLRAHRSDLEPVAPYNGGGPAEALRSATVDAVVLGAAEARRLSLAHLASEVLDAKAWVPAAGQGSLLLVSRKDEPLPEGLAGMDHAASRIALAAERACHSALGGGSDSPLGVLAVPHGRWIRIWGMIASADGTRVVRGDLTGSWEEPEQVGEGLAELLSARGAGPLLAREGSP